MLMPGKGEWNGKALWQLVVLGDPGADSDWAEGSWETLVHKGEKQWCCFIFIMHNLHASSC